MPEALQREVKTQQTSRGKKIIKYSWWNLLSCSFQELLRAPCAASSVLSGAAVSVAEHWDTDTAHAAVILG